MVPAVTATARVMDLTAGAVPVVALMYITQTLLVAAIFLCAATSWTIMHMWKLKPFMTSLPARMKERFSGENSASMLMKLFRNSRRLVWQMMTLRTRSQQVTLLETSVSSAIMARMFSNALDAATARRRARSRPSSLPVFLRPAQSP